jgi:PAS domain S-box-containing protein
MVIVNETGEIVFVNRQTERLFGYTREELLGRQVEGLLSESFRDRHLPHRQTYFEDPDLRMMGVGIALQAVRKDGQEFPVEISLSPLKTTEGLLVTAAIRDITDRKRAEEELVRAQRELAESEKQYRLLFDANPNPMWVFDRLTLRFLTVNDAAVRHYGYSLDEFLSMTVRDIRPQEEVARFLVDIGSDHTRLSTRELWKHQKKDGTIIDVEITSQSITFRTVEAELVLAHDVTEQKRTQEALKRSEEDHRMLFEQTPDGIFVADALGYHHDVNPGGIQLLGYSRDGNSRPEDHGCCCP